MIKKWGARLLALGGLCVASACTCSKDGGPTGAGSDSETITVLRVESPSPDKPGAEHCTAQGKDCAPIAPQQRLRAGGLVRTFAGGKASLDFGGGRRVDLDSLSETILAPDEVKLQKGQFTLDSRPLVEKEKFAPLQFTLAGKKLSSPSDLSTTASVAVAGDETLLTVRRGIITGLDFPGFQANASQAGQTVRLAGSGAYRTGQNGQELPTLPLSISRIDEFGGLLSETTQGETRGLGTMTARLPNTDQVRDGVYLKKHHVKVVIRDGFARTEVEEEFSNTTPHILEGRFRFPVPGDASLSRLALWVGDDLIEGEVLERQRAASIYASIVDRPVPRDPALLEWVTGGEMSLKVFPIEPKKSRRVILAYNQALSTENGLLRYVYPLSLGQGRENAIEDLEISVHLSESKGALRNIRVQSHPVRMGNEGHFKTVSLRMQNAVPTQDFVLLARRDVKPGAQLSAYVKGSDNVLDAPFAGVALPKTEGPALGHFALRVSADLPEGFERPSPLPQDRAVIIDVSHSQSQETIAAEAALAYGILRDMEPSENFVLLACDSACQTFPSGGPAAKTPEQQERALAFLRGLRPGGSSDIAGSLVFAASLLKGREQARSIKQIILISDGQATSGDLSAETIAQRVRPALLPIEADVRLVGAGRTVDEDVLLGLASELDATFDLLRSGTALTERIGEISMSLRKPVLKNPTLSLPASLRAQTLSSLPALRLGQEIIVTGEIMDLAGGQVSLAGHLSGAPYRLSRPIHWDESPSAQNPLVPRLWARERIQELHAKEETPAIKAEIIRLSQAYRTMSRHTSFLVLESEKMYKDFGVARTSKSESDQPETSFSQLDFVSAAPPDEQKELTGLTSFEDVERHDGSADAERGEAPRDLGRVQSESAPKRSGAAAPRPAAVAPEPKKKSDIAWSEGSGKGGMGAPSSKPTASGADESGRSLEDEFIPWHPPSTMPPRSRMPRPRRAHLTFTQANDEWRKWGSKNIDALVQKLSEDSQSRARNEAYIRGHLQHGRFAEARRVADLFVKMDPDYAPARELLAYAAVVDGDHELSRKMLDVQTEAAPRDILAHTQSARAFEAVGDAVRSCAHYRSLAELAPNLKEATLRAEGCWAEILGLRALGSSPPDEGDAGQLQVDVTCDPGTRPQDCPSPVVISPDGAVLSPWTPGTGKSTRTRVSFVKLRSGDYYVLVLGGAPRASGKVVLTGRHENQAFRFEGGGMQTVAKTQVSFY